MCIRDRRILTIGKSPYSTFTDYLKISKLKEIHTIGMKDTCLLYTSDAADERSSVDLGGRRIIKKKKTK